MLWNVLCASAHTHTTLLSWQLGSLSKYKNNTRMHMKANAGP